MPELKFGLWGTEPEGAPAWGARAIIEDNYAYEQWLDKPERLRERALQMGQKAPKSKKVSLVWDRQTGQGGKEDTQRLRDLLNAGPVEAALEKAVDLLHDYEMVTNVPGTFTLFENEQLIIKGDTGGSCGYLYLIAYEKRFEEGHACLTS